jgi:hydroxymethylpyrimidine/phosphomethylpyrimidine kinase
MKVVLTIAGSDSSSGGAGIQADLSFWPLRNQRYNRLDRSKHNRCTQSIFALPLEFIAQQIDSVLSDFDV